MSQYIEYLLDDGKSILIEADTESDLINAVQMATCAVAEEIQKTNG